MSSKRRGKAFNHQDHLTKGQRLDKMARKKDERAIRNAHRRERQAQQAIGSDGDTFASFSVQLAKMGLQIRDIPGDGNCLFRALGDQLEGHGRHHLKHRHDVVEYMRTNRQDFEPFVEDDVPFDRHIALLSKAGTYAGNDCIVAFARLHKVSVIIHQLDSPVWQVHGTDKKGGKQLHISYHNGDHYCSVRRLGDHTETPANIKLSETSGSSGGKSSPPHTHKQGSGQTLADSSTPSTQTSHNATATASATWDPGYESPYDDLEQWNNALYPASGGMENGVVRAYRDEADVEQTVMEATGCHDVELVRHMLVESGYDVESTIGHLLMTYPNSGLGGASAMVGGGGGGGGGGLWGEEGTGTRIFGAATESQPIATSASKSSGAKPKKESASQTKRVKKLEKKARAAERRRGQNLAGTTGSSSDGEDDINATVITQNLGTLKI